MQLVRSLRLLALWSCAACAPAERDTPVAPSAIWSDAPAPAPQPAGVRFLDRSSGDRYGLPKAGQRSIAELIALFPVRGVSRQESDIFVAPDLRWPSALCRGGKPSAVAELPMTLEAVVTLYPRAYLKLDICGQEERFYGSYTIEDDTGGLVVLRDSRVAPFSFGDRVRLTVRGLMLTYGADPDTRAVLVADVESVQGPAGPVLFERTGEPFTAEHVGKVYRIEGYVVDAPTSDNFNKLILSAQPVATSDAAPPVPPDRVNCALVCSASCGASACGTAPGFCDALCATLCEAVAPGAVVPTERLPVCWSVGLSSELGRRGLTYTRGQHLRVTGPVVHQFDRQIWVQDPAQIGTMP